MFDTMLIAKNYLRVNVILKGFYENCQKAPPCGRGITMCEDTVWIEKYHKRLCAFIRVFVNN